MYNIESCYLNIGEAFSMSLNSLQDILNVCIAFYPMDMA